MARLPSSIIQRGSVDSKGVPVFAAGKHVLRSIHFRIWEILDDRVFPFLADIVEKGEERVCEGAMDIFIPFSAETQAGFYKAEAEMIRFGERVARLPHSEYMKKTLLAIDAVFAVRMSHDISLPPVPLIVAYDVAGWKYHDDVRRCLGASHLMFQLPEELCEVAVEAMHYMQALQWVAQIAKPGFEATPQTIERLNQILLYGKSSPMEAPGFRSAYLPHKKGASPASIPQKIEQLCAFCNGDYFSPLGQASVIHHAFERVVPFDSMIDRTGLLFAFMPMFRRGLFADEFMVPICWGASLEKEYRRTLKDASRDDPFQEKHRFYRERWAVYNVRNTYMAVVIANMFLSKVDKLRRSWRNMGLKIPANSAIDKLLDLFLAIPQLATRHAASCIGKSYGATNDALHQLVKAGIVKEIAIDNRERVFVCEQSAALITDFVRQLEEMGTAAVGIEE